MASAGSSSPLSAKSPARSRAKAPIPTSIEALAAGYARDILRHIERRKGVFCRHPGGVTTLLLDGESIPLNTRPDNCGLVRLLLRSCGIGSLTLVSRLALQRLLVAADERCVTLTTRRFSALVRGAAYVPIADGTLLRISRDELSLVANGQNDASLWIEHPYDAPFHFHRPADPAVGLSLFEHFLVDTLACALPSLRWLVAINAALVPFLRDALCARFILVQQGPSQSGKTSGAQRFTRLLGLGEVKGDYSVAALGNLQDVGLLVIDNKEQDDFDRAFVNFCLYLSTGAERARSDIAGNLRVSSSRPIAVITSIEGVAREELRRRCIDVEFLVRGTSLPRACIEERITDSRHVILSSLMLVLQRFLASSSSAIAGPLPEFSEHFDICCRLLQAFASLAGKPPGWADSVIADWAAELRTRDPEESELEMWLRRAVQQGFLSLSDPCFTWQAAAGSLYVSEAASLLVALHRVGAPPGLLPRTPAGLSRRLHGNSLRCLRVLDESSAPEVAALRRQPDRRPLGLFVPHTSDPAADVITSGLPSCPPMLRAIDSSDAHRHCFLAPEDSCFHIWDYLPGAAEIETGATAGPANALIRDLQIEPPTTGALAQRKAAAIAYAARCLTSLLDATWSNVVFIPMPPSKPPSHPGYDSRLVSILQQVATSSLDIRCALAQGLPGEAKQKGISPEVRAKRLSLDATQLLPRPSTVCVFDDVLASGAHFAAAKCVLSAALPGARIIGLFLARCVRPALAFSMAR